MEFSNQGSPENESHEPAPEAVSRDTLETNIAKKLGDHRLAAPRDSASTELVAPSLSETIDQIAEKHLSPTESEAIKENFAKIDAVTSQSILVQRHQHKPLPHETLTAVEDITAISSEFSLDLWKLTPSETKELSELMLDCYAEKSIKARQAALSSYVARIRSSMTTEKHRKRRDQLTLHEQRLEQIEERINNDQIWEREVGRPFDIETLREKVISDSPTNLDFDDDLLTLSEDRRLGSLKRHIDDSYTNPEDSYNGFYSSGGFYSSFDRAPGREYSEDDLGGYSLDDIDELCDVWADYQISDEMSSGEDLDYFYDAKQYLLEEGVLSPDDLYVPGTCLSASDLDFVFEQGTLMHIPITSFRRNRYGDGANGPLSDVLGRVRRLNRPNQVSADTNLRELVAFSYVADQVIPERILQPKNLLLLSAASCLDVREQVDKLRQDFEGRKDAKRALEQIGRDISQLYRSSKYFIEVLDLDPAGIAEVFGQQSPSSREFYSFVLEEIRKKTDDEIAFIGANHPSGLIKLDGHMRKNFDRDANLRFLEAHSASRDPESPTKMQAGLSPDQALPSPSDLSDIFKMGV